MTSWQYLKGYRDGAKSGPGYDHVLEDARRRLAAGEWHDNRRDTDSAHWRGYGAGFVAKVVGVDLGGGAA